MGSGAARLVDGPRCGWRYPAGVSQWGVSRRIRQASGFEKGGSIGQREYVKLGSRGSHRDDFDRDRPGLILFLIGGCVFVFLALGCRRSGHLLRGRVQDTIVDLASNVIRVGCVSPTRTSELCLPDHGYVYHAATPVPGRQNCLGEQRFRCSPSFALFTPPLGGRPAPAPDCVAPCIHQ